MSDMVTITVDGVEVTVPNGTIVVDAAKQVGNNIPVFCYHPKMEPVGMCRMCLVEIGVPMRDRATGEPMLNEDGTPQLNFGRGLQTGCTVRASEGMVVRTQTEPVDEAREAVIEFLLTSHPLDCPICDKGGECPLQNLTMEHGKGDSRMHFADKMKMDKHVPLGELIYLDRERCIQCGRCVRFQDEIADDPVIHFHNRGRRLEIVTLSDPGFDSYWSGNTTDICPVGALTTSDFRFGARPWELTASPTLSPHDPAGTNMTFSTRREAKSGGKVVIKRVMPRQNEWVNEVWMSDRDRFVHHFAESDNRLLNPMVRKGGKLVEASWDEALALVAEKLQANQASVAGLSGDRVSNEDMFLFQKLFRKTLKSNDVDLANRRLAGGDVVANVGIASGSNLKELGKGDAILVVTSDLHEVSPIWWLRVKQAAERGATLVTLNLRKTRLDKFASHVLRYEVGTAVQTVRDLINLTKVESEADTPLAQAAKDLIEANNLVAFYGFEGVTYDETSAIAQLLANLLLVKTGDNKHAGQTNSGLIPVWPHNNTQGAWDMGIHPALLPGYKAAKQAGKSASEIYAGSKNGNVKALYVMGADPVGDGFMTSRGKLDFLVVQELFLTPTAKMADVVLPAQSWAERDGTFTSGERRVQRYYPAIAPRGEARPDWQIIAQVTNKIDETKVPFAASLVFKEATKAAKQYKGMDYRSLAQVQQQWPDLSRDDLYYGGTSYENKAGLGQQWAVVAESKDVPAYDVSDVKVTVPSGLKLVQIPALYNDGTLIQESAHLLGEHRIPQPTIYLNAEDAKPLSIASGDQVKVSLNGETVTALAHVNGAAPRGLGFVRGVKFVSGTAVADLQKAA